MACVDIVTLFLSVCLSVRDQIPVRHLSAKLDDHIPRPKGKAVMPSNSGFQRLHWDSKTGRQKSNSMWSISTKHCRRFMIFNSIGP
jgi:hypothetical protein